jgi:hypothetical protein
MQSVCVFIHNFDSLKSIMSQVLILFLVNNFKSLALLGRLSETVRLILFRLYQGIATIMPQDSFIFV